MRRAGLMLLTILATAGAAAEAQAAGRAEVLRVTASPAKPIAGGPMRVKVLVRGAGPGATARTRIRLRLRPVRGKRRGRALFASLRTPKLRRGKRARLTGVAIVPLRARGKFRLVACPGRGKRGCARARRRITVRRPRPRPIEVKPRLDRTRTKVALIGPRGGTVATTAANGTKLTLAIPPRALTAQQRIAITPLTRLRGLPFKLRLRGGADLGPNRLRLLRPAKLKIDPPRATRVRRSLTVGYGRGEAGLVPGKRRPKATTIELMHFSGGALVDARPAQWIRVGPRLPSSAEARAAQRLAVALEMPGDAAAEQTFVDALRDWYRSYVKPRIELAANEDTLLENAIGEAEAWLRYVSLRGVDDEFESERAELARLIEEAIVKSFRRSVTRCAGHHDVLFHARRLLVLPRTAAVLGIDAELGLSEYQSCLRFDLEVDTTITLRGRPVGQGTIDTRTQFLMVVPIRVHFAGPEYAYPVGNTRSYERFSENIIGTRGNDCQYFQTYTRGSGGFSLSPEHDGGGFDFALGLGHGNQLLDGRLQLQGGPVPIFHGMNCNPSDRSVLTPDTHNVLTWRALYDDPDHEAVGNPAVVRDWRVFDGAEVYATKDVARAVPLRANGAPFGVATESTRFELRHVPE